VGLVTSTPHQIIAGSNFAYMRQLKGELKS